MSTKTKTETVNEEVVEETKTSAPDPRERIPYTVDINWENPRDKYLFVSVNDYTAKIERGTEVYIPRFVAEFLEQQKNDERAAKLRILRLEEEYRQGANS